MPAGPPLQFTARGKDDSGIISLSLLHRPVGSSAEPQRAILFDDGQHGDSAAVDGYFAGMIPPLPPAAPLP
ncbi:MAG: choice-of-anchor X domain-containing protein [Verrucomicrobiales bacterium]